MKKLIILSCLFSIYSFGDSFRLESVYSNTLLSYKVIDQRQSNWKVELERLRSIGYVCEVKPYSKYLCKDKVAPVKNDTYYAVIEEFGVKHYYDFINFGDAYGESEITHNSEIYTEWEVKKNFLATFDGVVIKEDSYKYRESYDGLKKVILGDSKNEAWLIANEGGLYLTQKRSVTTKDGYDVYFVTLRYIRDS